MLNIFRQNKIGNKLIFILPAVLAACSVGHDYKKPEVITPVKWNAASQIQRTNIAIDKKWWIGFHDEKLNALVDRVVISNKDLKIVEARIQEVRALRMSAASSLYPQVNAGVQAQRGNPGLSTQNKAIGLFDGRFDASWEIDLFGGNHRNIEASDAMIEASKSTYQNVTITLIAEMVREYVTLRELQSRYDILEEISKSQKRLLELSNIRLKHGATNSIEVSQAEAAYNTTQSNLSVLDREVTASIYRIYVLSGSEDDAVIKLLKAGGQIPTIDYASLIEEPAIILNRRPDIVQAENYLHTSTALTAAAISDLYPKVSISSLFGWQNSSPLPSQNIWGISAGAFMPLLNFGKIKGNIDASNAREQQAYLSYRKAVIEAVADVETKLSDYAKNKNKTSHLLEAVKNSEKILASSHSRFNRGLVPLQSVLAAKINVLQTRDAYLSAQAEEMKSIASLQKSIGL